MKTSELTIDGLYHHKDGLGSRLIMLLDTKSWMFNLITDRMLKPADGQKQIRSVIQVGLPALMVTPFPQAGAAPVAELAEAARIFRAKVAEDGGYRWERAEPVHRFDSNAGPVRIVPALVLARQIVQPWEQWRARMSETRAERARHQAEVEKLREQEAARRAEVERDLTEARELLAGAARLYPGRFEVGSVAPGSRTVKVELDDLLTLLRGWQDLLTRVATDTVTQDLH